MKKSFREKRKIKINEKVVKISEMYPRLRSIKLFDIQRQIPLKF